MSNISLLTSPASAYSIKMMPVYNGLPFVVNSTRNARTNFKYTADVYVAGTKVATIKQNKDISSSSYGIFDIGRIVENYIVTTTANLSTATFSGNTNSYKSYYIKFGCEYERFLNILTITNQYGYAKINFSTAHDLRVGDYVSIQNTKYHNFKAKVTLTTSTSVTTDLLYQGGPDNSGVVIEAEQFYDNAYVVGNYVGFAIPTSRPTRINVGDRVVVDQAATPAHLGYNGEWLVTAINNITIGPTTYKVIVTDCPFLGSSPVNGGMIYSISKYSFKNLTTSTTEYAFDAGFQYKEWLSYNPTNFVMKTTKLGRFLTNSPKTVKIRRDELATLSFLHTSIMTSDAKKLFVQAFDSNNSPTSSAYLTIGFIPNTYARVDVSTGPYQLEPVASFTLVGASYYETYLVDISNNRVSEKIIYEIDDSCYRYTQKRLKWKNRLGGWDFFTFNLRSDKETSITRQNFGKFRNSLNSSNKYTYSLGNRGLTTFNVKAFDKETLRTNWLSDAEASWLEELFTSPEVYIMDGVNELPIVVADETFVLGEKENVGLISYTINIEYAFNKIIQRN
jgi:hypothetical protein